MPRDLFPLETMKRFGRAYGTPRCSGVNRTRRCNYFKAFTTIEVKASLVLSPIHSVAIVGPPLISLAALLFVLREIEDFDRVWVHTLLLKY